MKRALRINPGLCKRCLHVQLVSNDRGSLFVLCKAGKFNPSLPKYPSLPVVTCPEYTPSDPQEKEP